MPCRSLLSLCCSLLLLACPAQAEESAPEFNFGGFGSFGLNYQHADHLQYRRAIDQAEGARSERISSGIDSVVGVQGSARANEQFEATLQLLSRQDGDRSWDPRVSWAFLNYTPNPDWSLRLGRVGLDSQLASASRWIGYSLLTVRPQTELLGAIPFDSLDGGDLSFHHLLGEQLLKIKIFHGFMNGESAGSGTPTRFGSTRSSGLILSLSREEIQWRAIFGEAKILGNGDIQPLVDGLQSTGFASAAQAASQIDSRNRRTRYAALEGVFEQGPLSLEASWFGNRADNDAALMPTSRSMALLGGYRLGQYKPYAGMARSRTRTEQASAGLPEVDPLIALNQATRLVATGGVRTQQSLTLGLRYDFSNCCALKFQIDQVWAKRAQLVNPSDSNDSRYRSMTLFSSSLDFVF